MRQVELGHRRSRQTVVMHIANHTDDLILFRIAFVLIHTQFIDAFTERVVVCEVALRKPFVDDGRADVTALVLLAEIASLQQRNSDRLKVL